MPALDPYVSDKVTSVSLTYEGKYLWNIKFRREAVGGWSGMASARPGAVQIVTPLAHTPSLEKLWKFTIDTIQSAETMKLEEF